MSCSRVSIALLFLAATASAAEEGLKVPVGFSVSQFADEKLANDIYCMTLDSKGRVAVSSRGWVKILEDTDGDGKADKAITVAETKSGAMGMLFDGDSLFLSCDGGLMEYRRDATATEHYTLAKKWFSLAFTEHGNHAIRRGPDGWIYCIAGNDSGVGKLKFANMPQGRAIEGGGIFRFDPQAALKENREPRVELLAWGFRNPYDFDFAPTGDILTYDSDTERDYLLPWYTPTRIFHIAMGQHHGWRLPSYLRSLARPDSYLDTVDILDRVGRGSPTGVACYRHTQFPEKFRGGLFFADWTFGKVYFRSLKVDGSSFRAGHEVFLEPIGSNGFAPTGVCVAPDGTLLISIGGRGTRGSVYRVRHEAVDKAVPKQAADAVAEVLDAPQPNDAWSRTKWTAATKTAGFADRLERFVTDKKGTISQRMRALEVAVSCFPDRAASLCRIEATAEEELVRARAAWALGRIKSTAAIQEMLVKWSADSSARVRIEAMTALESQLQLTDSHAGLSENLLKSFGEADKRVRLGAARLFLEHQKGKDFDGEMLALEKITNPRARRAVAIALASNGQLDAQAMSLYLPELAKTKDAETVLDIIRLAMLVHGDWRLDNPSAEVYSAYELKITPSRSPELAKALLAHFPSTDRRLNLEIPRLLAMLGADDPAAFDKILSRITTSSDATDDVHYLIVLSKLKAGPEPERAARIADAFLNLDRKLQGQQLRIKQNWDARLGEVLARFLAWDPTMASALLKHERFVDAAHVGYALRLPKSKRTEAAQQFYAVLKKDADFAWSPGLVDLLAELPEEEVLPFFRKHWSEFNVRESMLSRFARRPVGEDREKFLWGLDSPQKPVQMQSLRALLQLPKDPAIRNAVPVLRLLRQSLRDAKAGDLRAECVALLNHQLDTKYALREVETDFATLDKLYQPLFADFAKAHPKESAALSGDDADRIAHWQTILAKVNWDQGDAERGGKLFQSRACATCHTGTSRIGPDLAGTANRFSRGDLFDAILFPSRDVAPAFRVNDIELKSGKVVSGIVIFESADGLIVQIDAVQTVRLADDEIASRRVGSKSLMPSNLLDDLPPQSFADLYVYLKSLK